MSSIYQHYKGGYYILVDIATHSETAERLVVYRSTSDGRVWVRPEGMFYGGVEVDGKVVPRFTLLDINPEYVKPYAGL